MKPELEESRFIETLLSQMTLEEKAGQLNQPPDLDAITDDQVKSGEVGTVICAATGFAGNEKQHRVRVSTINRLQRLAVEESRLKIPLVFARDVVHGYRTVAPIPLGQAASFSPRHVQDAQEVAAMEASADGIRWAFSPMLDIGRDPRWGRVAEGYGEDPYLCSILAEASVKGLQGSDLSNKSKVAACMKHFSGYGAVEGGRDYNTGEVTEYTFRNLYLRPFYSAVKAGVATAMSGFLEIGGLPVTCNPWLLRTVLRDEWGFDGPVVSDWNAINEVVEHGRASDVFEATAVALTAGTDIDMAAQAFVRSIPNLVCSGRLDEKFVNEAVLRVLRLKCRLGLFQNPYVDEAICEDRQFETASQSTVLELARRCLVLLKNSSGLLPLRPGARVGLFGHLAQCQEELFGTWTPDGIASDVTTVSEALRSLLGESNEMLQAQLPDQIVSMARSCDVSILVLGESAPRSGEANSISDIGLPPGQIELLKAVKRTGVPVVSIVLTGRPLDLSEVSEHADSILLAFHPGVMGGIALAEVLTGKTNPSGKLPITFPRSLGQVPIYYNRKATGRPVNVKNPAESRLVDLNDNPLYPFGFGLGFSTIEYSAPKLEGWSVKVTLTNNGTIDAEEVVQLYLRDEVGTAVRPIRELIGFARVSLASGETREIEVNFEFDSLGFYNLDGKWVVESGWFRLAIGSDSDCKDFVRFQLDGEGAVSSIEHLE